MEQDFQKPPSGHSGDLLWSGTGAVDQALCVVCVLEEGREKRASSFPWGEALRTAQEAGAEVLACHVRTSDLSHYGRMDHLAPASAMSEFEDYVRELNREEAAEAFAPLLHAAQEHGVPVHLHVLEGKKTLAAFLEELSASQRVQLFFV